ncbi:O-fucosyltransferase 2-like [Aristolochia californica]|uniref:O-fucosyltransferase 2-like n=1 Tax=Aristolochia californica TaxID=171875 RepID=UPI0035E2E4DD
MDGSDGEVEIVLREEHGETRTSDFAWSSAFVARSHSSSPRSRPASPRAGHSIRDSPFSPQHTPSKSRLSYAANSYSPPSYSSPLSFFRLENWKLRGGLLSRIGNSIPLKQHPRARRKPVGLWRRKRTRGLLMLFGLVVFFFFMNWWMLSRLQDPDLEREAGLLSHPLTSIRGEWSKFGKGKRPQRVLYNRLLALAAHALAEAEDKPGPRDLWEEPLGPASAWKPCAYESDWEPCEGGNGYILVSANGGISQQRVAICNAVAVARLLNATLVLPRFLYSSVWRDGSQFSDIYQEEHFIQYLKPDIRIVKELPMEFQSLDLEAIGSLVTDEDIIKEAKPSFYLKNILPILLQNRIVHFVGFGNRLAFDPIAFQLQKLRCRCNFHALKFIPKIQETGALLVQRLRQHIPRWQPIDHNLVGPFAVEANASGQKNLAGDISRYLALHLRFEIDMAAYSMCDFGGGEEERQELEAYRKIHFPALTQMKKTAKLPSASALRAEGRCPLTPEEAVLMLAALGFNRKTRIFVAGADIYGGKAGMAALRSLYPNLVTKDSLLSSMEIGPFQNFSSQLAALDFIGCTAADAFAMTDSGSQLSSLVSGYRIYYGAGGMPTIRPNKRRLAGIFSNSAKIEWEEFEERLRKAIRQSKKVQERPVARSIYRHPRCRECMCKTDDE